MNTPDPHPTQPQPGTQQTLQAQPGTQQSEQNQSAEPQAAMQQTAQPRPASPAGGSQPARARIQLIFATNNPHKVDEIQSAIGDRESILEVFSLKASGIDIDIPEPHDTLEANAAEKSSTIYRLTGKNCFGEDTGLEVSALNGEPGVRSARYAGEDRAFEKNTELLLKNLGDHTDRRAQFRTVISLILDGQEHLFTGICTGRILRAPAGDHGFGYDPVFAPDGEERSFAQMTMEEKGRYSHRKKATDQLVAFLRSKA